MKCQIYKLKIYTKYKLYVFHNLHNVNISINDSIIYNSLSDNYDFMFFKEKNEKRHKGKKLC